MKKSESARRVYNLDIDVPQEILAQFPQLQKLLANADLQSEFKKCETSANRSKLWFHLSGSLSLLLMTLMLLIASWRPVLKQVGIETPHWVLWVAACSGASSFVITALSVYVFRWQENWLKSRFVTERLRQWKFQQLLDGAFVEQSINNLNSFENELKQRWGQATFDTIRKPGAMSDFLNAENFKLFVKPSVCTEPRIATQILSAYYTLRLDYEAKNFSLKKDMLISKDMWTSGIAKFAFVVASILAMADIIVVFKIQGSDLEPRLFWILGAAALTAALISIAMRIFRSANAVSEETERYSTKWVALKTLSERFERETEIAKQVEYMIETERLCVEELREFLRTVRKTDYIL